MYEIVWRNIADATTTMLKNFNARSQHLAIYKHGQALMQETLPYAGLRSRELTEMRPKAKANQILSVPTPVKRTDRAPQPAALCSIMRYNSEALARGLSISGESAPNRQRHATGLPTHNTALSVLYRQHVTAAPPAKKGARGPCAHQTPAHRRATTTTG